MQGVCGPQNGAKIKLEQKSGGFTNVTPWFCHNAQKKSTNLPKCMK